MESELLSFGYVPLNKIVIKNQSDELMSDQYVKAVNKMGQKVYILLDADNMQNIDSDLTLVETKNGNIIPYSLKNGALKMAGMDASGIAFECQGGLCVVSNVMNEEDENLT